MAPTTSKASTPSTTPPKKRTRGFEVIRWIEAHCVFTNGEWVGKPFRLLPWQKRVLLDLFEVRDDGTRRYRWAYISVPKKNGKTELAAALGLYFLIGDGEPSPLVVCAAASDDQADLVFGAAKRMAELSPTLSQVTERYEREILVPSLPGAKLRRVAAAAGTNDGQNIHAVICDELHEWDGAKGEAVWNVLTNGTGARRQPMVVQITTAGWDLETVCGRQYEYARGVERGEFDDPRYFSFITEAPEAADFKDPEVWRAANPSYGVTVRADFFLDQLPPRKTESVFRRYFLNQWVSAEDLWLPPGAWAGCHRPELDLNPKLPLAVGIDIGLVHDSTAVVLAQRQGDDTVVRAKFWLNPYPVGHSLHDKWELDLEVVRAYLRELRKRFPVPATRIDDRTIAGPAYCYDPWSFTESAQALADEGLAMVKVPQTATRIGPAARYLYEQIVTGRIAHDGDPILAAHLANVVAVPLGDNGWRLRKPKGSTKKIDGAVALMMAVDQAQEPAPKGAFRAFAA